MLGQELSHAALNPLVGLLLQSPVSFVDIDPAYCEDNFLGGDVKSCSALFSGREYTVVSLNEAHEAILPYQL